MIGTPDDVGTVVARAVEEDLGAGDASALLIPPAAAGRARVIARESAVVCGRPWFDGVFEYLDPRVRVSWQIAEGEWAAPAACLCELTGPAASLLTGERTALNFLQTLSATATVTARYVERVAGTGARILDTRKTVPCLRTAQKYAVRVGGGSNHRMRLDDAILIKENHIAASGSIEAALGRALAHGHGLEVEIEVESVADLERALAAGAARVLLDNFSLADLRAAVELNAGRARLEASGGVSLDNVREIALTGVDDISVGALTKNVSAVDLSMRFLPA